jgi:hypothetical protein
MLSGPVRLSDERGHLVGGESARRREIERARVGPPRGDRGTGRRGEGGGGRGRSVGWCRVLLIFRSRVRGCAHYCKLNSLGSPRRVTTMPGELQ